MINLYDGLLTDILKANNITDEPATQALSHALREGMRLLHNYSRLCHVYCGIDTMPDKILDLLAAELRTQYYRGDFDIEVKRALIRNTIIWHMTAGTPAAVEEMITVVFGQGKVSEWFEYGGEPYFFRLEVPVTEKGITADQQQQIAENIKHCKNVRSWLEQVNYTYVNHGELKTGAYTAILPRVEIFPAVDKG